MPSSVASAVRSPTHLATKPTRIADSGKLEITVAKASFREERPGFKFKIRQHPQEVLQAFDEFANRKLAVEAPSHFFVSFEYGIIPIELREFVETEPSDLLKVAMRNAIQNVIYETLLDAEYSAKTLKDLKVPPILARLRSECVPFNQSSRHPKADASLLTSLFEQLLVRIVFVSRAVSQTAYDVQPFVSHSLPTEVGDRKEFEHIFNVYEVEWPITTANNPCMTTKDGVNPELCPYVVAKAYRVSDSGQDRLLGICGINTAEIMDHRDAYRGFWKSLNTPLLYKLVRTDTVRGGHEMGLISSEGHSHVSREAFPTAPLGQKNTFSSLWRVLEFFYQDGCNPIRILYTLLDSLKKKGDSQQLPNGFTLSVCHGSSNPFFGEVYFQSNFVAPCSQRHFCLYPQIRTMAEWQRFHTTMWRSPHDRSGGPILTARYNPNVQPNPHKKERMGKVDFELNEYKNIRQAEQFDALLQQHQLMKWKHFFTGHIGTLPAIHGGTEQWLATESVHETAVEDTFLGSNWIHSVNFHFGPRFPKFLIEIWVQDEFCGEYLLPEISEIAQVHKGKDLFRLTDGTNAFTRKDSRKQTAPTQVKGWIYLEATWRLVHPRSGRLSLKLREARNISTRSTKEEDVMPGAPQAVVWMFNKHEMEWQECLAFTPFQHALYFLDSKEGNARIMQDLWEWDDNLMEQPEPSWFNYFSWDTPGSLSVEEREIPVLVQGTVPMQRLLHLHDFETRYENVGPLMWQLCKNGVPSVMRPYIWVELTGSLLVKAELDRYVRSEYYTHMSAYEYISDCVRSTDASVFNLIESDVELFGASHGLDSSMTSLLESILKNFTYLCAPPTLEELNNLDSPPDKRVSIDRTGAKLGLPVVYSSRLILIAHHLALDFGSMRFSEEEIFYILLALTAIKQHKRTLPVSPFLSYFAVAPEQPHAIMPNKIPVAFSDACLLRTTIQTLHPDLYFQCLAAGVALDVLFAPMFQSLFAGVLPTQSLYRLWDMLFNMLWVAPEVVDVDVTYDEMEKLRQQQMMLSKKDASDTLLARCVRPPGLIPDADSEDPSDSSSVKAHRLLFDGSMGRRILFAFAYSFALQVLKAVPRECTALELRDAIQICGAHLRDPSEVVRFVERGDFSLFTSRKRINQLQRIHVIEQEERSRQLKASVEQVDFVTDVIWPRPLRDANQVRTNYVLQYNPDPNISRYDKWSGVSTEAPGLATKDLKDLIYPALKYHSLYADPGIRRLPPKTQGRVTIKIDRIEFKSIPNSKLTICVSFDKLWLSKTTEHKVISSFLDPQQASVFVFNITRPPPYTAKIAIKTEDDNVIAKLSKAIPIKKLTTQGSSTLLIPPEKFEPAGRVSVHMSWAVWVPTSEMFLPELGGRGLVAKDATLRPGTGIWGDLGVFFPMYVGIDRNKLAVERDRFFLGDSENDPEGTTEASTMASVLYKFQPLDRPRCFNGFNKIHLEDILYVGFPNFIHCIEDLVCIFGQVKDRSNFQQVLNTNVSMREFLTTLVLASNGNVLDKVAMLFDLYGHHEPEKILIQEEEGEKGFLGSNALYYYPFSALDAPTPSAFKQAATLQRIERMCCSCDPILSKDCPEEIYEDPRVRMNAISLASCSALVQQIMARSCIHLNTLDCMNLACQIFDPHARTPRVIVATIQPAEEEALFDKAVASDTDGCMACTPSRGDVIRNWGSTQVDVTSEILEWIGRSTAETGWYGLNFFKWYNLKSLDIIDPFPKIEKRLTIVLTPTGDISECHSIIADVDGEGNITGGMGGNYFDLHRRAIPFHMEKIGPLANKRDDIFFVEGSRTLLQVCYAFDLHRLVIDKFQFVMAFLSNPIMTEILRRSAVYGRGFFRQPSLKIAAAIDCKFSSAFCDRRIPLLFQNNQIREVVKKRAKSKGQGSEDGNVSSDIETATSDEPAFQEVDYIDIQTSQNRLAYFARNEVHASVMPEDLNNVQIKVTVLSGKDMHDVETFGKMDPYVTINYGPNEARTKAIHGAGKNALWDETFIFNIISGNTSFNLTVKDEEKLGSPEVVGFANVDFTSMLMNYTTRSQQNIPLTYKRKQEGEVELIIEFLGLKKPKAAKKKKGRMVQLTIGSASQLTKITEATLYVAAFCGTERVKTRSIHVQEPHCTWNEKFDWIFDELPPDVAFKVLAEEHFEDEVLGETEIKFVSLPKGPHDCRLPLYADGKDSGLLDVTINVMKTSEAPQSVELDFANGCVKITIRNAESLPTALTNELMAYCSVDFDGVKEKTQFGKGDNRGNVSWHASFQYSLLHWPKRPVQFEIAGMNPQQGEVKLANTEIDLNAAMRQWRALNGNAVLISQKLDGLAYATGGVLNLDIDFVAPPKNVEQWRTFRILLESVRNVKQTNKGHLVIRLSEREEKTRIRVQTGKDPIIKFTQTIDFKYSGEQTVDFEFWSDGECIGSCAYDLWGPLCQGTSKEAGELSLMSPEDIEIGKLRLALEWLEAPPKPWPDMVLVKLEKVTFERVSTRPMRVAVQGAAHAQEASDIHEAFSERKFKHQGPAVFHDSSSSDSIVMGSTFQLGRSFGVAYFGQPSFWVNCELTEFDSAQSELLLPSLMPTSHMSSLMTAPLKLHGMEIGTVKYSIQYCAKPHRLERCAFVKLSLVSLKKLLAQAGSAAPRELFISLDPGDNNEEAKMVTKTVPCEASIKFNDTWVIPYNGQAFFRVALHNADFPTRPWSSADINIWELMHGKGEDKFQLFQGNALKGGKVYLKSDFICPPHPAPIPKILRVGFRSGENLGGDLRQELSWHRMRPVVRIRSGEAVLSPPTVKDLFNPIWGDWSARINLTAGNPLIVLELFDEECQEIVGGATLHIWDIFRDPWNEWAGVVTLRRNGEFIGSVHVALRLQIPQRVPVFFNRHTDRHPALQKVRVFPSDTPVDFRRKFVAACREIAAAMSVQNGPKTESELFYELIELTGHEKVVVLHADGSYSLLSDKKRFIDIPEIFPEAAVSRNEELPSIDLAIVHVIKPKKIFDTNDRSSSRLVQRKKELDSMASPNRTSLLADIDSSDAGTDDNGFTYFPLGETTLPASLTIARNEVALDFIKLSRPLEDFYAHKKLTFNKNDKHSFFEQGDLIKRLSRRTFEAHPAAEAQLGALAYGNIPLSDLTRLLVKLKIQSFYRRSSQWVPSIIHNISPDMFLLSRMAPFESVIGYDYPNYARTHSVSIRDCLPAFHLENDAAKGERMNFFQDVGPSRGTEFISVGGARWLPPRIRKTKSELSEEGKKSNKRGSTTSRKLVAHAPKSSRIPPSSRSSSPLYSVSPRTSRAVSNF